MADLPFDLSTHGGYIRSFQELKQKLGRREQGRVLEIAVSLPNGKVTAFMETRSLYLIGFRGAGGKALALNEDDNSFVKMLQNKFGEANVADSGILARYTGHTASLGFRKQDLSLAVALNTVTPKTKDKLAIKAHVDRLAFAIPEAARFIPIRCAVACELADDYRFKQVIARICDWSERFLLGERMVEKPHPDLSIADQKLRNRLGDDISIRAFEMNSNYHQNLSKVDKWLRLLSEQDQQLTRKDRQRLAALTPIQDPGFKLGRFVSLKKNWQKLSAINDPNFYGILDEMHLRYTAAATRIEGDLIVPEWH